eukprot:1830693-Pyramimonas_sp.AAC.1
MGLAVQLVARISLHEVLVVLPLVRISGRGPRSSAGGPLSSHGCACEPRSSARKPRDVHVALVAVPL